MISIFEYQQYREFIRDYYLDQKRRKTGMTYARFSAAAGIRSPNYMKLVIDGEKNLTQENVVRFARALGLKETEADYFEALVQFNQAKSALQREYFEARLKRVRERDSGRKTRERILSEQEFEAVSDWRHHALMVLTNINGFEERLSWLRERFFNLMSEGDLSQILERLQTIKLLARDESGRLRQTHREVKTKPELGRVLSRAFYEGFFARAALAMKLSEPEEREFGAVVVGLSESQIPELKKKVRAFIQELNEWALENPAPTQVYAMSVCAFPVTSPEKRARRDS